MTPQGALCYTRSVASLEQGLLFLIRYVYDLMQWPGVVALMAMESACIPLPSELIMPLSGWMLVKERSLPAIYTLMAGAYGALGCTIGSVVAYVVGMWGGRPVLERYGKYILVSRHDLELADRWFSRYGSLSIFISRLLPVVRTFISLPAGIARMRFIRFLVYTFWGSFPWCFGLACGGYYLGEHWERIREVMRPFDPFIFAIIIALIAFYIYRHIKNVRSPAREPRQPAGDSDRS